MTPYHVGQKLIEQILREGLVKVHKEKFTSFPVFSKDAAHQIGVAALKHSAQYIQDNLFKGDSK